MTGPRDDHSETTAPKREGAIARLRREAAEKQDAKREAQENAARDHAERMTHAGVLVTSGVFGMSTVEVFEGGYVRVAEGDKDSGAVAKISRETPFEVLRNIAFEQPANAAKNDDDSNANASALGNAVAGLIRSTKRVSPTAQLFDLAASGVTHLVGANSRRSYLTITTDKAIYSLTNDVSGEFLSSPQKGHNSIGLILAEAGLGVLGRRVSNQPEPEPTPSAVTEVSDLSKRLRELSTLHEDGILTDAEFADAKSRLLESLS